MTPLIPETLAELERLAAKYRTPIASDGTSWGDDRAAAINALPALIDAARRERALMEAMERIAAMSPPEPHVPYSGAVVIARHAIKTAEAALSPNPAPAEPTP